MRLNEVVEIDFFERIPWLNLVTKCLSGPLTPLGTFALEQDGRVENGFKQTERGHYGK